uniref:Uncharacterized protein n=1 Tax=Anguilla anguilla TaxID=7936 RepID=A0A0E9T091_ANGAN
MWVRGQGYLGVKP